MIVLLCFLNDLFYFLKNYNPTLVKMSCDNLRFLSCLANMIFQKDIQYAINIINVSLGLTNLI